jgi:predicted permease
MFVFNTLAPIIALVGLGAVLRATGFLKEGFLKQANPLVYWVALPCLLFHKTSQTRIEAGTAFQISLCLLAGLAAGVVLGYLVGYSLRQRGPSLAAFVQGTSRSNLVYVGLSVLLFALTPAGGEPDPKLESVAVLAIAPLIPAYNIMAVVVLLIGRPPEKRGDSAALPALIKGVVTNPLILAAAAGVGWSLTGLALPLGLTRTLATVSKIALPLALIATGTALSLGSIRGCIGCALAASVIKVLVVPLVGFFVARWLGLADEALLIALVYLACPTAVVSFVMAEQLDADHVLAGSIVVVSTILSMPVLGAVLLLAR